MLADQCGSAPRSTIGPLPTDIGRSSNGAIAFEHWYVAQTQPRAKDRAIAHLERQGYEIFCPCYRKTVRHARKVTSVLSLLSPNYLFLHLNTARNLWRAVNGTRGIARLISQGEAPAPLPRGVVEDVLAKVHAGGVMDWVPTFKIGQAVRIADGPFAYLVGKLERIDAAGRVRVLLDLLGRHVSVALLCEGLIAAA